VETFIVYLADGRNVQICATTWKAESHGHTFLAEAPDGGKPKEVAYFSADDVAGVARSSSVVE
jgi:hypothetical protein